MQNLFTKTIPVTLSQLQVLLDELHNCTIGQLARKLHISLPQNTKSTKGFMGQLIERYLGIANNNSATLDLAELGLEVKTIPVNKLLKALETTYVCTVESNARCLNWEKSWVRRKLAKVLWIPILYRESLADNIILKPRIWQPNQEELEILSQDYEELMELFYLGYGVNLNAKFGTYLHIRPKAANSSCLVNYLDYENSITKIVPKGFYLRTQLTTKILQS